MIRDTTPQGDEDGDEAPESMVYASAGLVFAIAVGMLVLMNIRRR